MYRIIELAEALKRRPVWRTSGPSGWNRLRWKRVSDLEPSEAKMLETRAAYLERNPHDTEALAKLKEIAGVLLNENDARISGHFKGHEMMIYVFSPARELMFYFACIT